MRVACTQKLTFRLYRKYIQCFIFVFTYFLFSVFVLSPNYNVNFLNRCVAPSCSSKITANDYLIVKSTGVVKFTEKQGNLQTREGPVYVHFLEDCLKSYFDNFSYQNVDVTEDTQKCLTGDERSFLKSLGLRFT